MAIPQGDRTIFRWAGTAAVLVLTALCFLAVLLRWPAKAVPAPAFIHYLLLYAVPVAAAVACYRFALQGSARERLQTILVAGVLSMVANSLHYSMVDLGAYSHVPNLAWQQDMQTRVLALDPSITGHSYRFLPNAFVRLLEMLTGDFSVSRDAYRNLFVLLQLVALYRFARLYTTHLGGIATLLLWWLAYPASIRLYAGQLTDPMSHLSILLALIFLERGLFGYFLLTVVIGSFAKESIFVLMGYYVLFKWSDRHYLWKVAALALTGVGLSAGVRLWVTKASLGYSTMSGVSPDHIARNWLHPAWPVQFFFTVGIFVPFVVLAWRSTPRTLTHLSLYLLPVLFASSLMFSWLHESRNYMPLVAVLAVITANYLVRNSTTNEPLHSPVA